MEIGYLLTNDFKTCFDVLGELFQRGHSCAHEVSHGREPLILDVHENGARLNVFRNDEQKQYT